MNNAEVWRLFKSIAQYYPSFSADDEKAKAWHRTLANVPFDVAQDNLVHHALSEKFPPTISEIRGGYQEPATSNIPSAEETRQAFEALEKWKANAVPMPDFVREELKRIAERRQHTDT